MCAEAEHVTNGWVDLAEVTVAARRDHGVVGGLPTQRPVAEFGGERGVTAAQSPFPQQGRKQEIGVGVALGRRPQYLEGEPPDRVNAAPGGAASTGNRLPSPGRGLPASRGRRLPTLGTRLPSPGRGLLAGP